MVYQNHFGFNVFGLHHAGRSILYAVTLSALLLALSAGPVWAQGADTVFRVQQLQEEVRELRGQVEQQAAEIERLKQQQRDQYLDLDTRLRELADGATPVVDQSPGAVVPGDAVDGEEIEQDSQPPLTDEEAGDPRMDIPEVDSEPAQPAEIGTIGIPDAQVKDTPRSASEAAKVQYDQAFQNLRDLRYAQAADAFADFLEDHPDSEYSDNAQYWLGESYYVTGNYDLALDAFDRLLDNFPDSPKTADALLKIGYTQYELKNWSQARTALEAVKARYPDTTLARLADNRLRAMRLEGHY